MKKNYYIILSASVLAILILTYIIYSHNDKNYSNADYEILKNKKIQNLNNQKLKLIGKEIKSLDLILQDSVLSYQNIIIFYYEGTDCQTCINKCINEIKGLSKKFEQIDLKIIASNTKISSDQLRYEYFKKIYEDRNGLLRRELMFLYSPAFIYLKNGRIETIDFILPDSKIDIVSNIKKWYNENL